MAIVATFSLAACGTSTSHSAATTVHPFDEIRASAVAFEADPSDPSREILHVTTTVPTICAVVWGPDVHLGRLNNSLSMNGTGITRHDVILPHVVPGTTYSYVLEGVAGDGTLYRSAVGTFSVSPASASATAVPVASPGSDITSRATVTSVSSQYSTAFAATNAIDGDPATEWATKGDGDHASITLDLGAATDIKGVEFVTRSMADGTAITSAYTVSIDGAEPIGPFAAATIAHPNPISITARGRSIRFNVTSSSGGNVGAIDIHIYG